MKLRGVVINNQSKKLAKTVEGRYKEIDEKGYITEIDSGGQAKVFEVDKNSLEYFLDGKWHKANRTISLKNICDISCNSCESFENDKAMPRCNNKEFVKMIGAHKAVSVNKDFCCKYYELRKDK